MNNEKWEKEFDEKFGDNLSLDGPFDKSYAKLVLAPALKDFISQTIQAAVEEERKRIAEAVKSFDVNGGGFISIELLDSIINKHQ